MVKKYNEVELFSTHPGMKAGLEGMIQNHQLSDDALTQALVQEFYEGALRFTVFRLNDSNTAKRLVEDVIIKAISNRHRYWGDSSLQAWIYQMVSDTIRKSNGSAAGRPLLQNSKLFSAVDQDLIDLALLHFVLGLSVTEIAFVQRKDKQEVVFHVGRLYNQLTDEPGTHVPGVMRHDTFVEAVYRLASGEIDVEDRQQLETHLEGCERCRNHAVKVENLRRKLETHFETSSALPQVSDEELSQAAAEILERTRQENKRRRFSISSKEAILIGIVIALVAIVGWAVSILGEEDEFGVSSQAPVIENDNLAFVDDALQPAVESNEEEAVFPDTGEIEPYEGYAYHRLAPIDTGVDLLRLYLDGFLDDDQWGDYSGSLVLESVFHYWSVDRNIQDVIKFRSRNRISNLSPISIVNYVEENTILAADYREGGSIEVLRNLTDAGFPVIIVTGGPVQQNQYDIVTGFWTYCECIVLGSSFVREERHQIEVSSFLDDWQESDNTYILIYPSWKTDGVQKILGEDIADSSTHDQQCLRGTDWNEF